MLGAPATSTLWPSASRSISEVTVRVTVREAARDRPRRPSRPYEPPSEGPTGWVWASVPAPARVKVWVVVTAPEAWMSLPSVCSVSILTGWETTTGSTTRVRCTSAPSRLR